MSNNKTKVLLVATESGAALAAFAIAIIDSLSSSSLFDAKSIVLSKKNGKGYEGAFDEKTNVQYVRAPQNFLCRLIYKIWPHKVISLIKKEIKTWNPDKVLFLTGDCQLSLFVLLHPSPKYAYVVHDLFSHEVQIKGIKDRLLFSWIKYGYKVMRHAAVSLTTSSLFQLECLKKMYNRKKITFTEFPSLINEAGKNGSAIVPELKNEFNYILFFGGINIYKGVDVLVEAFSMLKDQNRKLIIAGRGIHLDYEHNNSIIRLNRFIQDNELRDLFKKAALVVYPYRSITMSGVLSFPYFFGNKVLLSDVPFFKQYTTENTFYFKNGDAIDLCNKMKSILSSNPNATFTNSYNRIFSKQKLIDTYYNFLKD